MTNDRVLEHYNAVKNNAGLFDFSIEGKIIVKGAGRVDFIDGLVSNDVGSLRENNGIYAAFLNKFGKILSDCIAYKFEDFLLINLSVIGKNNIIKKLKEEAGLGKSEVEDATLKHGLFSLQGPKALGLVSTIIGEPLGLKQQYECTIKKITINKNTLERSSVSTPLTIKNENKDKNNKTINNKNDIEILITKNNRTDFNGYDIFVPAQYYKIFKELILDKGKKYSLKIINNDAYNILRLEAKIPLFGIDFGDKNILPEVTEKAASYEKGCYVGQEIVARVKNLAKGITAKKLRLIEIDGNNARTKFGITCGDIPGKNTKIMKNGKEAGFITSAAFSPKLNKVIGFGFLDKGFYEENTEVFVDGKKAIVNPK